VRIRSDVDCWADLYLKEVTTISSWLADQIPQPLDSLRLKIGVLLEYLDSVA